MIAAPRSKDVAGRLPMMEQEQIQGVGWKGVPSTGRGGGSGQL